MRSHQGSGQVWANDQTLGAHIEDQGRGFSFPTALGAFSGLLALGEMRLLQGASRSSPHREPARASWSAPLSSGRRRAP
jgi:hypothetical protein